jgi:hypothetical protein
MLVKLLAAASVFWLLKPAKPRVADVDIGDDYDVTFHRETGPVSPAYQRPDEGGPLL